MPSEAPVGVFDSGVGGLSVLADIRAQLPSESLLYVADSGHVPYGEKSPAYIRARCRNISAFLLEMGAKALVLACNTATVAAIADLRAQYPNVPILGLEPAIKPAAAQTRSGVIGVLATSGTLASDRFATLRDQFAGAAHVVTQACPGLVECVERGDLHSPETRQLLARYVAPLLAAGCDTLILGCTHYPFLKPLLRELVPQNVRLIDTGSAVARQLERRLSAQNLQANGPARAARFWSSGNPQALAHVLPVLWGEAGDVLASDC